MKVIKFYFMLATIMTVLVGCNYVYQPVNPNQTGMKRETTKSSQAEENSKTLLEKKVVKVGALKGATSLGLLFLDDYAVNGYSYDITMATQADELLPLMLKGELDIALVPANAAANLYNKSEGKVCVIDINTLGVLYFVTGNKNIKSIEDLKGQTIYMPGKGTTPEASIRYVLSKNGFDEADYVLEFKSEPTEVAAILAEDPDAIGFLPQPFVTAACIQNDKLSVVLDMNEEWNKVSGDDSAMVTGVSVARKDFVTGNPLAVADFIRCHEASVNDISAKTEEAAKRAVERGIIAKEPIAMKALPKCNIVCISGTEMKTKLEEYINVLYDYNSEMIGGALPETDFYYE